MNALHVFHKKYSIFLKDAGILDDKDLGKLNEIFIKEFSEMDEKESYFILRGLALPYSILVEFFGDKDIAFARTCYFCVYAPTSLSHVCKECEIRFFCVKVEKKVSRVLFEIKLNIMRRVLCGYRYSENKITHCDDCKFDCKNSPVCKRGSFRHG